ncbi:MAG: hypothetical protein RL030_1777 [Pseudomonadota bacterium]|jgi:hypothetical protein
MAGGNGNILLFNGVPGPTFNVFSTPAADASPLVVNSNTGFGYYYTAASQSFSPLGDAKAVHAGYVGIRINTNKSITLDATWRTILNWDLNTVLLNGAFSLANGTISVAQASVYLLCLGIDLQCTSVNTGREFNVRLFNETDAAPVNNGESRVYIGRDTVGNSVGSATPVVVSAAAVDKNLSIQLQTADAFTGVVLRSAGFSLVRIGV